MDYQHVLAATDFSEHGDLAVRRAAQLALASGARLTVAHVLPELETPSPLVSHYEVHTDASRRERACKAAREALEARVPDAVRASGIAIDYEVSIGDPVNELLALDARLRPDLIVLSSHGRRGFRRFIMGSVAERVLQLAKADVLSVREDDAEA